MEQSADNTFKSIDFLWSVFPLCMLVTRISNWFVIISTSMKSKKIFLIFRQKSIKYQMKTRFKRWRYFAKRMTSVFKPKLPANEYVYDMSLLMISDNRICTYYILYNTYIHRLFYSYSYVHSYFYIFLISFFIYIFFEWVFISYLLFFFLLFLIWFCGGQSRYAFSFIFTFFFCQFFPLT